MTAIEYLGDRRILTAHERSTEPRPGTATAGTTSVGSDAEVAVSATDEPVLGRVSPDPLSATDRYRLVTPYAPRLW